MIKKDTKDKEVPRRVELHRDRIRGVEKVARRKEYR
jgi:hypothetical protein